MFEITFNIVTNVIKFIYVYLVLHTIKKVEIKYSNMCIYTLICNIGYIFMKDENYTMYIVQGLYIFICLYILGRKKDIERDITIPTICIALFSYEIINMATNFIGAMVVVFFSVFPVVQQYIMVLLLIILKSFILCGILVCIKKNREMLLNRLKGNYLICFIYLIAVFIKIPFLYTDIRDGIIFKVVLGSIACCTAIFFIISQIDKHNAAKEKAKVEESNKLLAAKLHKSQEILPAMVQVLSDVTEKNGAEMEERKAHELLEEVSHLYEQQLKENGKEDLQLKSFKSTGLTMLDKQLIVYQREAVDKEINLDIFVQAPINDVIWKSGIDQLRLQRAVGDLIRNSFQAVRKEQEKIKHVLLIVGCRQEDILEIAVMDNGVEIPLHVLETFGKRGVTTGGTGNGLADIWEFVQDAKASLRVDEFEGTADLFTKKISIIFDKKHICYLNSSRSKNVNGFFWNNKINE